MPKAQTRKPQAASAAPQPSKDPDRNGFSVQQARMMFEALSMLGTRAGVSAYLGKSFNGRRDLYEALGRSKVIQFADFMAQYRRQDIAKAVIDVPVRASWRKPPEITESEEEETTFEKAWTDLATKLKLWDYFSRVDRLSAIGEYAVLLLGFDDGAQLWQPVKSAKQLLYVMPYSQANATVAEFVTDTKDPRFSLPHIYSVQMRSAQGTQATRTIKVHWSRVLHVSEDNLEDDMLGLPRLEAPFNDLQSLDLVAGGSGEMFWRGAFPGFGLKADEGFKFSSESQQTLEDEAEEYVHDLRRYMRLAGASIQQIEQQVADPKNHADLLITLIAAVTRIPKRILLGSEMGELASSQDEANWYARVDERRELHCEPKIVRPFIDRCIEAGVLPKPADQYVCQWEPLLKQSRKDKADAVNIEAQAIGTYVTSGGATLVPPAFFMKEHLGYTQEQMDQIDLMQAEEELDADGDGTELPPDPPEDDTDNEDNSEGGENV